MKNFINENEHVYDVIVVGAGYTGISAAVNLERYGASVLVLEASDRIGGRALSTPNDFGVSDLGAHYYGPKHKRMMKLVDDCCAPNEIIDHAYPHTDPWLFNADASGKLRWTKKSETLLGIQGVSLNVPLLEKLRVINTFVRMFLYEAFINVEQPWNSWLAKQLDQKTFKQFIEEQDLTDDIKILWEFGIVGILSVYPDDISALQLIWYSASNLGFFEMAEDSKGGPQHFGLTIGAQALIERYADKHFHGTIKLNTTVNKIDHSSEPAVLTTNQGTFRAKRVLVTATHVAAGKIKYSPEVSPQRRLLFNQIPGHASKAIIYYKHPWWRNLFHQEGTNIENHRWTQGGGFPHGKKLKGVEWLLESSEEGKNAVITTFISPEMMNHYADNIEALKEAIASYIAEQLEDERARDYLHIDIYRWADNPTVIAGPNTYCGPGVLSKVGHIFNQPEGQNLFFGGAEYSTHFSGYLEGALASGERTATDIAQSLGHPTKPYPKARGPQPLKIIGWGIVYGLIKVAIQIVRVVNWLRRLSRGRAKA